MVTPQIETAAKTRRAPRAAQHTRKRFIISPREYYRLPDAHLELPAPEDAPNPPTSVNILATFLTPLFMVAGFLIYAQVSEAMDWRIMLPMLVMGLGAPIGNLTAHYFQKRTYVKLLAEREQKYRAALAEERRRIHLFAHQQKKILNKEYPLLPGLMRIAQAGGRNRRLWWRKPEDEDFLALRIGTSSGPASFEILPPQMGDKKDPLYSVACELVSAYRRIDGLPALLYLPRVGSLALSGTDEAVVRSVVRRLVLDVIVHHAPEDVEVAVIADHEAGARRWEWLKWVPHTRALTAAGSIKHLAFNPRDIDQFLDWLDGEFKRRLHAGNDLDAPKTHHPAWVILLDDRGEIRQEPLLKQIAAQGFQVGMYLMFVGGRNWPRECRARLKIDAEGFQYVENWVGEESGGRMRGTIDLASRRDAARVARTLAGLETATAGLDADLPETVRLFDILTHALPSVEAVRQNWGRAYQDRDLLRFPFGLKAGRKGLEPITLNLLPEDRGGVAAYHSLLIGTTGSGKSEFMKSLVLAAAFAYSPQVLNFFFLDFKGGAAFNVLKDLPHVVGVVTNLSPDLVERGLSALVAEVERRQRVFGDAGVADIWGYNAAHKENPMPHMLLVLDEFARGMEDFESLPAILDKVVRIGRSLGMYLLLANQNVNAAVDRLLNNVGWKIALKVARKEEMAIIDRSLPIAERAGQGYLQSLEGNAEKFQAAYAGLPVFEEQGSAANSFKIFRINADGSREILYEGGADTGRAQVRQLAESEEAYLIDLMVQAAADFPPARPIYLDPLPTDLLLEDVLADSEVRPAFHGRRWHGRREAQKPLIAPVGYLDFPEKVLQEPLMVDFNDQDGHLWIVGSPGSGKSQVLATVVFSLALTHTPAEAQFYLLDFGAGGLRGFERLPHTGAVIRPAEQERFRRLMKFLEDELNRRSARVSHLAAVNELPSPAIFLVIDNFAELKRAYPDDIESIARLVRDGRAVNLHVIVTTNRGADLWRAISSNIARRVVLQLAERDEYMDVLGQRVQPLEKKIPARGYWRDGEIAECQVAKPVVKDEKSGEYLAWSAAAEWMNQAWQGERPRPVRVMPECVSFEELWAQIRGDAGVRLPVGVAYETLDTVAPDLQAEIPQWLVLGPPRSGKSNFLACAAHAVLRAQPDSWQVYYLACRRVPVGWGDKLPVTFAQGDENLREMVEQLCQGLEQGAPPVNWLILVDDLGAAFEPGKSDLVNALNNLASLVKQREGVFILAAGTLEELRAGMTSPFVNALRQGKTGVSLCGDSMYLDFLGARLNMAYSRLQYPPGRGFWVSGGRPVLVQTPLLGDCEGVAGQV